MSRTGTTDASTFLRSSGLRIYTVVRCASSAEPQSFIRADLATRGWAVSFLIAATIRLASFFEPSSS